MDLDIRDGFLAKLVADSWGRQPTRVPAAATVPVFREDEVFRLLAAASEKMRAGHDVPLRLYLDGGARASSLHELLPNAADRNLGAWSHRIRSQTHGVTHCLTLNQAQRFSAEVTDSLARLLAQLYELVPLTLRPAQAVVFAGDYQTTPTGIHRDDVENLCFVVSGRKEFLLWPPDMLQSFAGVDAASSMRVDSSDLERLPSPARLQGVPGDMLYLPRNHWHMAHSGVRGLRVTVSLALHAEAPTGYALPVLKRAIEARSKRLGSNPFCPREAWHNGRSKKKPTSQVLRMIQKGMSKVEHETQIQQLLFESALGFEGLAEHSARFLEDRDAVAINPWFRPRWITREGKLLIAARGSLLYAREDLAAVRLLRALNRGDVIHVGRTMSRASGARSTQRTTRKLLDRLYAAGALRLVYPA